jgi:ferric-dicitrate binding protein FerR (iron transport regulator)
VRGIRTTGDELTLVLRHGTEVRLGRAAEVELKLVIARRVLRLVDGTPAYVDVSIPERPVAG